MKNNIKYYPLVIISAAFLYSCNSSNDITGGDDQDSYIRKVTLSSSKWISKVIEYQPAPGQFINTSSGKPEAANSLVGKKGILSLGGFGGYVIFQFDHTVLNRKGYDFVIHGNAFGNSSEPGIVMVALDLNRNGTPDPNEWYELYGSEHDKESTVFNYGITYRQPYGLITAEDVPWTDSQGSSGVIAANEYYGQCYYPLFTDEESLNFGGTCLKSEATLTGDTYHLMPFDWGYADNFDATYAQIVGTDSDTKNSNKFDISNARNSKGDKIEIEGIDFIKVYTAVNQQNGWIGESSTEICGAISLSVESN